MLTGTLIALLTLSVMVNIAQFLHLYERKLDNSIDEAEKSHTFPEIPFSTGESESHVTEGNCSVSVYDEQYHSTTSMLPKNYVAVSGTNPMYLGERNELCILAENHPYPLISM